MPAVNLALDDVNREKNLLPGFILKLHSNDSEVRRGIYEIFNSFLRRTILVSVRARTGCLGDVQFIIQQPP